jgi:cyclopropane-fatty-acyl-phospholipid synthase
MEQSSQIVGASAKAIQVHYDIDTRFFSLWLDEAHSYSPALFDGQDIPLLEASLRKMDYIATEARAEGAKRVLDVGCGWGSMLDRLKTRFGVKHTVGLTLSQAQVDHIHKRWGDAHEVRLESWEHHLPSEGYDAIVSIASFAHFARPNDTTEQKIAGYRRFFEQCRRWLQPGGRLVVETSCYEAANRTHQSDSLAAVFPESELPRLSEMTTACDRIFRVLLVRNQPYDYERTIKTWYDTLRAKRSEAVAIAGEEVVRRYEHYLQLTRLGFRGHKLGLVRITLEALPRVV